MSRSAVSGFDYFLALNTLLLAIACMLKSALSTLLLIIILSLCSLNVQKFSRKRTQKFIVLFYINLSKLIHVQNAESLVSLEYLLTT